MSSIPLLEGLFLRLLRVPRLSWLKLKNISRVFSEANASILMSKLMQAKYDGCGNVCEHVLKMIDMSNKLKDLECPLPQSYVIHYIMMSLPSYFQNFKINYSSSDKKWTMAELIANLSQEEERLRTENDGHLVNFAKGSSSGHRKFGEKFSH
jgi:hypothetical protein